MESIENTGITSDQIILTLLREDLRSNKLILGLNDLGLDAGKYHLDITALIFGLIGLKEDNKVLDIYISFMERALEVKDVEELGVLKSIAAELYAALLAEKALQEGGTNGRV